MSNHDDEPATGISDEDLPEELRPSDDNPLAQPLTEDDDPKSPEELDVMGGKTPEESGDGTGGAAGETDATDHSEG
jgi:hypothetical protein